ASAQIPVPFRWYAPLAVNVLTRSHLPNSQVIDHYENPRNVGSLPKSDKDVGTGLVGAPACGSSYTTELLMGKTADEALRIKNTTIAKELALPPVKLHCSSKLPYRDFCRSKTGTAAFHFPNLLFVLIVGRRDKSINAYCRVAYLHLDAVLAEDAVKAAIRDWQSKRAKPNPVN
ncbi:MAG: iron sulfur cluster assembly protein 1, mitochondrial precursor, partial [Olpidium bornovanus]